MEIRPELHQKQIQKIVMTPQLQQAIKMLQLSNIELTEKIEQERSENPALQVEERESEFAKETDNQIEQRLESREGKTQSYENGTEDEFRFEDKTFSRPGPGGVEDKKRQFLEGAISREETLVEHLLGQLHLLRITPQEVEIGGILVNLLDWKGYLSVPMEEISEQFSIPVPRLEEVLKIVQGLDPPGVGARTLQECLLIQLRERDPLLRGTYGLAAKIVESHLGELRKNKFDQVAKKLKVTTAKVKEAFGVITKLEPYPGRQYDSEENVYIVPDVIVEEIEGDFEVIANNSFIPRLTVNKYLERLARSKNTDKRVKDFASEKVQAARNFIHSIQERESTLLKVTRTILGMQRDFFEKGPKHLKPLILKDVASALGLHESTISRITSSKYVQTPFGVLPLKYFFSNSIPTQGNGDVSSRRIKEEIREIIMNEGGKKHFSDEKIRRILLARGVNIARRTIAKYRKELRILSSNQRR